MLANIPEQQQEESVSEDDIGDELKALLNDNEAESAPNQVAHDTCLPADLLSTHTEIYTYTHIYTYTCVCATISNIYPYICILLIHEATLLSHNGLASASPLGKILHSSLPTF